MMLFVRANTSLRRRRMRPAFTLTEMVVSMVVMTLVTGGLMSAMMIAAKGMNAKDSALSQVSDAARVLDDITAEMFCAQAVTERTAKAVTFTVPDRNGDLNPEVIRYVWSGSAGAPLTREYNGSAPVNVLEDVVAFDLAYQYRTITEEGPPGTNESAEMLLFSHEPTLNLLALDISSGSWGGEYFRPALAQGAVSWKVTRLEFRAKLLSTSSKGLTVEVIEGDTLVELRLPGGDNRPSDTVVSQDLLPQSMLVSLFSWHEVSFSGAGGLSPGEGLCVVLSPEMGSTSACAIEYQSSGASVPGGSFLTSSDGGSSWTASDSKAMALRVYGTVTTLGDPPTVNRTFLTAVEIGLAAGPDAGRHGRTTVRVLNAPEVSGS